MSEHLIWQTGYAGLELDRFEEMLQAVGVRHLVDIRYAPWGGMPEFKESNLRQRFPKAPDGIVYHSVRAFGNKNYQNDEPVQLFNPQRGLELLDGYLQTGTVALMCACPKLAGCHREDVINLMSVQFPGLTVHSLPRIKRSK